MMPFDAADLTDTQMSLLSAAQEVRKGWCQNEREDADGNVCAIGALVRAAGVGSAYCAATNKLSVYLGSGAVGAYGGNIPEWNDTAGRTAEQVATALEQAAFA